MLLAVGAGLGLACLLTRVFFTWVMPGATEDPRRLHLMGLLDGGNLHAAIMAGSLVGIVVAALIMVLGFAWRGGRRGGLGVGIVLPIVGLVLVASVAAVWAAFSLLAWMLLGDRTEVRDRDVAVVVEETGDVQPRGIQLYLPAGDAHGSTWQSVPFESADGPAPRDLQDPDSCRVAVEGDVLSLTCTGVDLRVDCSTSAVPCVPAGTTTAASGRP